MSDNTNLTPPAYLKPSDFKLINGTPDNVAKLQIALDYVQMRDPAGTAILKAMWMKGEPILLNNYEPLSEYVLSTLTPAMRADYELYRGVSAYRPEAGVVLWNPDSALQVRDDGGNITGIQSSAVALVHESTHAIDPNLMQNLQDKIPQYRNLGEYVAIRYENMSSENLGEVIRNNHGGFELRVDNPTTHTGPDPFGKVVWQSVNEYGVKEYGPEYNFTKLMPTWMDPAEPPYPPHAPYFGSNQPSNSGPTIPDTHGSPDDIAPRNDPNDGSLSGDSPWHTDSDPVSPWNPNPGPSPDPFLPPTGPFNEEVPATSPPEPTMPVTPDAGANGSGDNSDPDHWADPTAGWSGNDNPAAGGTDVPSIGGGLTSNGGGDWAEWDGTILGSMGPRNDHEAEDSEGYGPHLRVHPSDQNHSITIQTAVLVESQSIQDGAIALIGIPTALL